MIPSKREDLRFYVIMHVIVYSSANALLRLLYLYWPTLCIAGSLYIESLGVLTAASDHETMLLPVGFW